jgi:hypothetical protein
MSMQQGGLNKVPITNTLIDPEDISLISQLFFKYLLTNFFFFIEINCYKLGF